MDADQQPEDHQASVALLSPSTSTSIIPDKPHQPVLSFPFALLVSSGDHFCHHSTQNTHGYIIRKLVIVSFAFTVM